MKGVAVDGKLEEELSSVQTFAFRAELYQDPSSDCPRSRMTAEISRIANFPTDLEVFMNKNISFSRVELRTRDISLRR